MVLTVSTGLCARSRLWQRQDGLMLTCILWKKGCSFSQSWSGWDGSDRRGAKAAGGTKENAQTSVTQARLWVRSNPLRQVFVSDHVHTQLQV